MVYFHYGDREPKTPKGLVFTGEREITMRTIIMGIAAAVGLLALTQTASADRVCKSACEGGSCMQKCVDHDSDEVFIGRGHDRERIVRYHEDHRPGIEFHAPGGGVEIGR